MILTASVKLMKQNICLAQLWVLFLSLTKNTGQELGWLQWQSLQIWTLHSQSQESHHQYQADLTSAPVSKTQWVSGMAWMEILGSIQPLPTWKLTWMTSIFNSFACSQRSLLFYSVAPNLTLRQHCFGIVRGNPQKPALPLDVPWQLSSTLLHYRKSSSGRHYWQHIWDTHLQGLP